MKNIIFLVVDSVMRDRVLSAKYGLNTTPFLSSIKDKMQIWDNIYSQAPYTEAATKALYQSDDVLNSEGYLFRYDSAETFISDVFKKNGYETHCFIRPCFLYPVESMKNMDHIHWTSSWAIGFKEFWDNRFSYYKSLFDNNEMDDLDFDDCVRILNTIFETYLLFLNPKAKEDKKLLEGYDNYFDYSYWYSFVLKEYDSLMNDKKGYVIDLLQKGEKHQLFSFDYSVDKSFSNTQLLHSLLDKNKRFAHKLFIKQFVYTLKNNCLGWNNICTMVQNCLNSGVNKQSLRPLIYWGQTLLRGHDIHMLYKNPLWKPMRSAGIVLDTVGRIITESTTPQFVMLHLEEPHYYTTYLTYDSKDECIIQDEINYAKEYLDGIRNNFAGLISYDLSLRYLDNKIEKLYNTLDENNKLDDTIIVLATDHGSSYNCYPPRKAIVNNMHSENYKIGFSIIDRTNEGNVNSNIGTSKDIIPTILDYLRLQSDDKIKGSSLLADNKTDCIITEYMGPGCPDLRRRKVLLSARSRNYVVVCESYLSKDLSSFCVTEIYDLKKDPQEKINAKIRNDQIDQMINLLQMRVLSIIENNKDRLIINKVL